MRTCLSILAQHKKEILVDYLDYFFTHGQNMCKGGAQAIVN